MPSPELRIAKLANTKDSTRAFCASKLRLTMRGEHLTNWVQQRMKDSAGGGLPKISAGSNDCVEAHLGPRCLAYPCPEDMASKDSTTFLKWSLACRY